MKARYYSAEGGSNSLCLAINNSPYGNKGDSNWEVIALSEGWANYRQWKMAKEHLNGYEIYPLQPNRNDKNEIIAGFWQPTFDNYENTSMAIYYGGMFKRLHEAGCSYSNLEKALYAYSIGGYKDNLIALCPALNEQITQIIKKYE